MPTHTIPGKRAYTVHMSTKTLSTDVAEALRLAPFGSTLQACGFRFWSDESLGEVVEVVLILNHDEWDDAAIASCELAREVANEALGQFNVFALPACRTRSEHENNKLREQGLWIPVHLNVPC